MAYTVQKSHYVGLGNPDARRMWLDNDIRADYGRFTSDRRQVLAMSGTYNPWRSFTVAAVLSAITGAPINETVGTDFNLDKDNTDRPIQGINDLTDADPVRGGQPGPCRDQRPSGAGVVPVRHLVPIPDAARKGLRQSRSVLRHLQPVQSDELRGPDGNSRVGLLHGADCGAVPAADAVRHPPEVLMRRSGRDHPRCAVVRVAADRGGAGRPVELAAQMELAVIQGTITDEAGAPLEGVTIRLRDLERGTDTTLKSDKAGKFYRRGLRAIDYEMTVEKEGYQPINDKIRLTTASERRLEFKLAKASPAGAGEFAKAIAAYNAGDFAGAVKPFEAVLAKAPNQPEARVNLALAYLRLNKPAEAVAQLEKVAAGGEHRPARAVSARRRLRRDEGARQGGRGVRERPRASARPEGPARVGSRGDARRGVLRQGRRRQGRRAVREGARRAPRDAPPRRSGSPRSTSARATSRRRWSCSRRSSPRTRARRKPNRRRCSSRNCASDRRMAQVTRR